MSVTAWVLAIPIFIMAGMALWGSIANHRQAISQENMNMGKRAAGAILLSVAYFPATVSWLIGQPTDYVPTIATIASYMWDFCVFLCIFEWVKMSRDEMNEGCHHKPCRPCPFQEDK